MKNRFLIAFAVLSAFAVGCKEDNIGNPGKMLANTDKVSSTQNSSATVVASVYGDGIAERGICWASTNAPTLEDSSEADEQSGAGTFTLEITGLSAGTTYYARAYAMSADGNVSYGSAKPVTTAPYLTAAITTTTAAPGALTVNAKVAGGDPSWVVSERGVYYSTSANPETTGTKVAASAGGFGDFTVNITGLDLKTKYYLKAYAISEESGTVYSTESTATTLATPEEALFFDKLKAAKLTYGVVRGADTKFVMHYTLDTEAEKVTITYLETTGNKDAKHVTAEYTPNASFTELTWTAVTYGANTFEGIKFDGTSAFTLKGTAGLALTPTWTATEIYSLFTHSNYGGVTRCSELDKAAEANEHGSISAIWSNASLVDYVEYNGDRSAITVKGGNGKGYMYRLNTFKDNKPYIPITQDVAVFSFDGKYDDGPSWAMKDATAKAELTAALQPFLTFWENPKGVIIIQETTGRTPAQGLFNFYAIHKEDATWVRWRFRESGK